MTIPNEGLRETVKEKKFSWKVPLFVFIFLVGLIAGVILIGQQVVIIQEVPGEPINAIDEYGQLTELLLKNPRYQNGDLDAIFDDIELPDVLDFKLKSHPNVNHVKQVGAGKQVVMWYDINSVYQLENALGTPEFIDMRSGKLVERDWRYVVWGNESYESPVYSCSTQTSQNGTLYEDCTQTGTETLTREVWKEYNSRDLKGKQRIGIEVEVRQGDKIDGVWVVGGKKIDRHAEWENNYWWYDDFATNTTGDYARSGAVTYNPSGWMDVGNAGAGERGEAYPNVQFNESGFNNTVTGFNYTVDFNTTGSNYGILPFHLSTTDLTTTSGAGYLLGVGTTWSNPTLFYTYNGFSNRIEIAKNTSYTMLSDTWYTVFIYKNASSITIDLKTRSDNITRATLTATNNTRTSGYAGAFAWDNRISIDNIRINPIGEPSFLTVTLLSPENYANLTSSSVDFLLNVSTESETIGVTNVTIEVSNSTSVVFTETNTTGLLGNYTFNSTFDDGSYNWTAWAYGNDSERYNATVRSFNIDSTPIISVAHPTNITYTQTLIDFNATSQVNVDYWIINYNGTNVTVDDQSGTTLNKNLAVEDGSFNLLLYANNSESGVWGLNDTIYFTVDLTEPTVTLITPLNDTEVRDDNPIFNASLTSGDYTLVNATLYVWNSTGLFHSQTNTTIVGTSDTNALFNYTEFVPNNYEWNVELNYENPDLGTSDSVFADNNFTFTWIPFTEGNSEFEDTVLETSQQTFKINVTTSDSFTVQNGRLVYNNTVHPFATKKDLGGGEFQLSETIFIPTGTEGFSQENRTFYWNITFAHIIDGTTFNELTEPNNQTVNELIFGLCGGARTIPMINFTMYDEITGNQINAADNNTDFQATFNLGAHSEYKEKLFTITNLSVTTNKFNFCTNNETNTFYSNLNSLFAAQGYTERTYRLNNATLTNSTRLIDLFLLDDSKALEFFLRVEKGISPLTNALVNVQKFFIGEGVYKTVELRKTSSDDGSFTSFLELDREYRFSITNEDNIFEGIIDKVSSCQAAPCQLVLVLGIEDSEWNLFPDVQDIMYNLSYSPQTDLVNFDFIDLTGTASSFRMEIYRSQVNDSNFLISNQTLFTSAGGMSFNMSDYSDGDFVVYVFVARSPSNFFAWLGFTKSEIVGVLGLLGLFFALLLILTIIFGLSLTPKLLVMAVPLSLIITKLMGIISISRGALVLVTLGAFLALYAMSGN